MGRLMPDGKELGEGSSGLVLHGLVFEQLVLPAAFTLTGPIMTLITAVPCEPSQLYLSGWALTGLGYQWTYERDQWGGTIWPFP